VVAHALLLAAGRLRGVALRALGRGAVNDVTPFALGVMLILMLVLFVPDVVPAFIPRVAAVPILRSRTSLGDRGLLLCRMACWLLMAGGLMACRCAGA
jgi:hypothetical protein